ncbi:suppressor of fused domain protein [Actinocorallia longicatena]|uniref:Suppressor of fused-like domain-containing protein n=1 Tax=Actinocorallia longicatena TaxID=111803 RepID=A0ABP6Q6W3_9ACTN
MSESAPIDAVEEHVQAYFADHGVASEPYDLGHNRRHKIPGLRIITVSPGPLADTWTYVTAGCSTSVPGQEPGLEFLLSAPGREKAFAELLAMIAYYHASYRLELAHSMPLGMPWTEGSRCDHLLTTRPRPHGPELEHCTLPAGRARLLRILPVTPDELVFRRANGHEALEALFAEASLAPADPLRASVVRSPG